MNRTMWGMFVALLGIVSAYAGENGVSRVEVETLSPNAYQRLEQPRVALKAISPIVDQALTKLELAQGRPVTDEQIAETLKSPAFVKEYNLALHEFCASHDNARSMACMHESASGRMDKFYKQD